jgi:hypothetical protein
MIRWAVNPIDEETVDGRTFRRPRVSSLGYNHSTVVMGANWCLSFVRGDDFTALGADPQCLDLLEDDYDDSAGSLIDRTVGDLAWSTAKRQRVLAKMEARGVDTSGYTLSTPLHRILRDLGRRLDVNLQDIRALWVGGAGAPVLRGTPQDLADDPGDSFVEVSTNTNLTAHTPTGSVPGTGWTEEVRTGTIVFRVNATVDRAEATSAEINVRVVYSMQPNPTGPEYDVQVTLVTLSTITTSPTGLVARLTDANNYYATGTYRTNDPNDKRLFKIVAGAPTELGSFDSGLAANDVLLFEVRDATKRLYKNGVQQFSSADNVLTSAGRTGLFAGNVWSAGDDIGASWQYKDFSYTMVAPSTRSMPFGTRGTAFAGGRPLTGIFR